LYLENDATLWLSLFKPRVIAPGVTITIRVRIAVTGNDDLVQIAATGNGNSVQIVATGNGNSVQIVATGNGNLVQIVATGNGNLVQIAAIQMSDSPLVQLPL
jgi:hypothetical protein